jgi:phosphoribosyl 1,2-cyclic phosphodiesterase
VIRFASLGSGSRGNALVVESRGTRVLLDCGFSIRETERRLARLGLAASDVNAILLTHEHSDHIGGAFSFALRHAIPVFLTQGCLAGAPRRTPQLPELRLIDCQERFAFNDLAISPYPVPHDSREPVQYVFSDGAVSLGVLTDAGHITPHMAQMLGACQALVLECNHDLDMLASGPYPGFLKARVGGDYGHLSNAAAAELLRSLDCSGFSHIVAAHLSEKNNTPELASAALAEVLGCATGWVEAATQTHGFDWRSI